MQQRSYSLGLFSTPRVVGALGLCLTAAVAQADDWPQWRGPDHNGVSRETGWSSNWPKDGLKQLWKTTVGIGFSSVTVSEGRLFTLGFGANQDTVYCLDAATGKEIWKHSYASALDDNYYEGGPAATPTVENDRVYTLGKRGDLFCFQSRDGKVIWQKNLLRELATTKPEWGFASSPLIEGDLVLLNVGGAGAAFSKLTGALAWASDTNSAGYASLVPFGTGANRAVAVFAGDGLVGVRVADGRELWRYPWVEEYKISAADPVFTAPDSVFISTYGRGAALLRLGERQVTEVWTNKNLAVGFSSCVLVNGNLYGIHGTADGPEKEVRCVDASTGALRWKQEKFGLGSVTVADGKLILLSDRGELVVAEASPTGFKPIARSQVLGGKCWITPVLANGRIYCRNAKGDLVCLDARLGRNEPSGVPVSAREPGAPPTPVDP